MEYTLYFTEPGLFIQRTEVFKKLGVSRVLSYCVDNRTTSLTLFCAKFYLNLNAET